VDLVLVHNEVAILSRHSHCRLKMQRMVSPQPCISRPMQHARRVLVLVLDPARLPKCVVRVEVAGPLQTIKGSSQCHRRVVRVAATAPSLSTHAQRVAAPELNDAHVK
jgi:hypothetical protein